MHRLIWLLIAAVGAVLGKRYGGDGIAQPRAILEDSARQPATARH